MSKLINQFFKYVGTNKNHSPRDSSTSSSYSHNVSNSSNNFRRKDYEKNDKESAFIRSERGSRSIRRHKCDGFDHFQAESLIFLKRKKKSLTVTLCNDEMTSDTDIEEFRHALISISTEKEFLNEGGTNKRQESGLTCDNQRSSSIAFSDRNVAFFTTFKECSAGDVMFGDGVRGKILTKGSINQLAKTNVVSNKENKVILSGTRLFDNCYHWDSEISVYAVLGIPVLKSNVNDICNECPIGKHVKASHQCTRKCSTSRVLELLEGMKTL
ncbi:gag-pol polyprotein [Cucumis melo var. makuwa]|uniref:Gag-pol polyprotein n=1 Tax=Cucumis melo var. makuwa TaxID=1194695 RepID=A0A5D3E527_CUCMM|nr:gag-pol polyprotein [Cucumis melo var. makuwa]TYK31054.1 gag-pol polyprotein [Cucumis melo var. makuwa]